MRQARQRDHLEVLAGAEEQIDDAERMAEVDVVVGGAVQEQERALELAGVAEERGFLVREFVLGRDAVPADRPSVTNEGVVRFVGGTEKAEALARGATRVLRAEAMAVPPSVRAARCAYLMSPASSAGQVRYSVNGGYG